MNHSLLSPATSIACLILGAASAGETTSTRTADTRIGAIERLLDVSSRGTGTVSDAKELFEDLELEMDLAIRVHFPRRPLHEEMSAKEERFVSERLSHPRNYRSELFRCLGKEWPRLFGRSNAKRQIAFAGPASGPLRYRVVVDGEELLILFGLDSPTIVGMIFPDGTSLGQTVDRCSERARVGATGGSAR